MATHYYPHITTGPLDQNAIVESFLAEEANILLWSPVALVAAGSGEYMARAGPTSNASDPTVIGVVVGPLKDAQNLYASLAAGDAIQVCTRGKCKVRVDGTDAIAVGDGLVSYEGDGYAKLALLDFGSVHTFGAATEASIKSALAVFALALYAATVDGDIIACFVTGAGGTPT